MKSICCKNTNFSNHHKEITSPRSGELTQTDPAGTIRFDFNDGLTVENTSAVPLRLRVFDLDGGNTFFDDIVAPGRCHQELRRYFLRLGFELRDMKSSRSRFTYHFNATGKKVLFDFSCARLRECIAWMTAVEQFVNRHRCRPQLMMPPEAIRLFASSYRNWHFLPPGSPVDECFATYRMALHPPENRRDTPIDHHHVALHRFGASLLGVPPADIPPQLRPPAPPCRTSDRPCVYLRTNAAYFAWEWRHPWGWETVSDWLARRNIDVRAIPVPETEIVAHAAEISTAKCLIGPPDAAAWLAWAYGVKVVLISGTSLPGTEIPGACHICELSGCNGCRHREWDPDNPDYRQCPRHRGCECTFNISPERVIAGLKTVI